MGSFTTFPKEITKKALISMYDDEKNNDSQQAKLQHWRDIGLGQSAGYV